MVTQLGAGGHFTAGPTSHHDFRRRVRELHHMLDRGINYIDVQWSPEHGVTAQLKRERPDDFILAWPLFTPFVGRVVNPGSISADFVVKYVKDHFDRYGMDHAEVLLLIALHLEIPSQPDLFDGLREGFETLKQEGLVDHLGFSCHEAPEPATYALENYDCFEVVMVPYSYLGPAAAEKVFPAAEKKDVGIVVMKPMCGGEVGCHADALPGDVSYSTPYQAAIRWVLSDPRVSTTVPGMHSVEQIDQLVEASAQPLAEADTELLAQVRGAIEEHRLANWA
jgi:predicted aldo/keto reductase-like oxidoreductase